MKNREAVKKAGTKVRRYIKVLPIKKEVSLVGMCNIVLVQC